MFQNEDESLYLRLSHGVKSHNKIRQYSRKRILSYWSGLRDLNPRSLGPKPSAIPNFAKPGAAYSLNIILKVVWKSKSEKLFTDKIFSAIIMGQNRRGEEKPYENEKEK